MTQEFTALADTFGWGDDDFRALNMTAIKAAFCDEKTRARIADKLENTDV